MTDAVIDVTVKPGARINHYRIQRESADAFHIATTKAKTSRDSAYETTSINLGGLLARHDIEVTLDDEGSHCAVDGLYLIGADQHSDTLLDRSPAPQRNQPATLQRRSRWQVARGL